MPEGPAAHDATEREGAPGSALHGDIGADTISVRQGAIRSARGREISVMQGAVGLARGESVDVTQGMLGTAFGGEVHARQSFVRFAGARDAIHLDQSAAWTVIANHAHVAPRSLVVFLVARTADGEARPVFDWRGAIAFGAAFGIVRSLLRLRRR
jgi:hypothetical protein